MWPPQPRGGESIRGVLQSERLIWNRGWTPQCRSDTHPERSPTPRVLSLARASQRVPAHLDFAVVRPYGPSVVLGESLIEDSALSYWDSATVDGSER